MDNWNTTELRSPGGTVRLVDAPQGYEDKGVPPVFIACGWSETPEAVQGTINELVAQGYRVLTLDYADLDDMGEVGEPRSPDLPKSEYSKALAILNAIKSANVASVHAVGHSEGAVNLISAASMEPQLFQKIVLVTPCGVSGRDRFFSLSARFALNLFAGAWCSLRTGEMSEFWYTLKVVKYFLLNPVQALREALGIVDIQISPLIRKLQEGGMPITIIHGEDDRVFPAKWVQRLVYETKIENLVIIPGHHNDLHTKPVEFVGMIKGVFER